MEAPVEDPPWALVRALSWAFSADCAWMEEASADEAVAALESDVVLLALVTVLLLMAYFSDRLGGAPPSSINGDVILPAIIAEAVLLPWAWWFDRHRALRQPP